MRPGLYSTFNSLQFVAVLFSSTLISFCSSAPSVSRRDNNPLNIDWYPAPSAEDGPPGAAGALRNPAYLPAQIGGIVGSYALSLVIVAVLLLSLAKRRRGHIAAGEEDLVQFAYEFEFEYPAALPASEDFPYPLAPKSPIHNFSYPTPLEIPVEKENPNPQFHTSSPQSTRSFALGVSPLVDPNVVAADREMAQNQLEEMYKFVMEQEEAKQAGVILEDPPAPIMNSSTASLPRPSLQVSAPRPSGEMAGILKKGRNKPATLDLAAPEPEKQSRASSFLSALKSPRKKPPKAINISSPIMTPMSGTFPRFSEGEEMETIPPRHYAPAPPPPVPAGQDPHFARRSARGMAPITPPDMSPESTMSIDERLDAQMARKSRARYASQADTEVDPVSAVSDRSTTPLVGLPSSPKPGVTRFPSLPASPKPGQTFNRDTLPASPKPGQTFNRDVLPSSPMPGAKFSRANAPHAIRTNGGLPLRAYEPAMTSPSVQTTKQTTFERAPLSPSGLRTPFTGAPVPYSPYQPYTPVVPMTPSLVTKADRKRMRQLQPKTPTLEMVRSSDDIW